MKQVCRFITFPAFIQVLKCARLDLDKLKDIENIILSIYVKSHSIQRTSYQYTLLEKYSHVLSSIQSIQMRMTALLESGTSFLDAPHEPYKVLQSIREMGKRYLDGSLTGLFSVHIQPYLFQMHKLDEYCSSFSESFKNTPQWVLIRDCEEISPPPVEAFASVHIAQGPNTHRLVVSAPSRIRPAPVKRFTVQGIIAERHMPSVETMGYTEIDVTGYLDLQSLAKERQSSVAAANENGGYFHKSNAHRLQDSGIYSASSLINNSE